MGKEIVNLYGPGYITDYIGNVCYRISPLSFYQVNPVQTQKLYGTALEYAGLTGEKPCGIFTAVSEPSPVSGAESKEGIWRRDYSAGD